MKKRRIRFDKIFIFLFVVAIIISIILLLCMNITNIYISGNNYLSDQEIIEISNLEDYPKLIKNMNFMIEKRLENNILIKEAKVSKKKFTKVYIEVIENKPLFYYAPDSKTILLDGTSIDIKYTVPTVLNYITDDYYKSFISKMAILDNQVLTRISEIEFKPSDVDSNRFLLSMNDGNYIYVNIDTFEKVNKYISILESLPDKKGILYLDYGNNFEIIE